MSTNPLETIPGPDKISKGSISRGVPLGGQLGAIDLPKLYSDRRGLPPDELRGIIHTIMKMRTEAGL